MKRADLEQRITAIARAKGLTLTWTEGGNHTKVRLGTVQTTIPRHHEINENTARAILRKLQEA